MSSSAAYSVQVGIRADKGHEDEIQGNQGNR